jgi:hypothetical protein
MVSPCALSITIVSSMRSMIDGESPADGSSINRIDLYPDRFAQGLD